MTFQKDFEDIPRLQTNAVPLSGGWKHPLPDERDPGEASSYPEGRPSGSGSSITFNDINRSNTDNASFSLATILYHKLSGKMPFSGSSVGGIQHSIRRAKVVALRNLNPQLAPELSDTIQRSLCGSSQSLESWLEVLEGIESDRWLESPSEEEKNKLIEEGERIQGKIEASMKREAFFPAL